MTSFNRVFLLGRLTREPDLRYTPKGTPVVELSLALNRVSKAQDGTQHQEVTFVPVTLWERLAEIALQYLKKGSPVFIEGRLQLDSWEDKQSGQKRSRLHVVAQNLQLLGQRSELPASAPGSTMPEGVSKTAATLAPQARPARAPIPEPDFDVEPF